MNPIAAPKTLRYEPDAGLPVAIEAKSTRRYFYPQNGDKFAPGTTNVIRMNLNASSFLDFSHSYLQFTVTNKSGAHLALDHGVPFFNRLQIMSGGQELEDIQEYSRLYSILTSIQGSRLTGDESSLTSKGRFGGAPAATAPGITVGALQLLQTGGANAVDNGAAAALNNQISAGVNASINAFNGEGVSYLHNGETRALGGLDDDDSVTFNVPIISAFFNIDKYFPLLLTEQGLDLYFYLDAGLQVGCYDADPGAAGTYEITQVKYVAHEVNLDDAFVNQMKASMNATGGVLSLSSTTYRYNQVNEGAITTGGTRDLSISCRVKSLKGMIVRPQLSVVNNDRSLFACSTGHNVGIIGAQFRIGSVLYPQSKIEFADTAATSNKGEMFNEIRKCFGTIGSYAHGTMLNDSTFRSHVGHLANGVSDVQHRDGQAGSNAVGSAGGGMNSVKQFFTIAYDFETFAKSATESGINVADRSLPVSLHLDRTAIANMRNNANGADLVNADGGIRYDCFAMCDCIIYIDLMGKITTRI